MLRTALYISAASKLRIGAQSGDDFIELRMEELEHVVRLLPGTSPGPGGITSGMLKISFDLSPQDLSNMVNFTPS